jgi:chromosome partitioning related protein ParA
VLLVDADVQPTLSSYYPFEARAEHGLSAFITEAITDGVVSRKTTLAAKQRSRVWI